VAKDQNWIGDLLSGYKRFFAVGTPDVELPRRNILRLTGVTLADNPNYVDPNTGAIVGATNFTIAPAAGGLIANNIFGDGSDGDHNLDTMASCPGMTLSGSTYSLTRDVYFNNLIVQPSAILANSGWRIFVRNVLTVYGRVTAKGGDGVVGAAGVPNTTTQNANYLTLNGGGLGGLSGNGGQNVSYCIGGAGGANGDGSYTGGPAPAPNFAHVSGFRSLDDLVRCEVRSYSGGTTTTSFQLAGGGGGASSRQNGPSLEVGGGAGGGVLMIACGALAANGVIDADGGTAVVAAGVNSYGAGGGGGGLVVCLVGNRPNWTGAVRSNGGLGGTGTLASGNPGSNGFVIMP
jgi:hypothetical protein